MLTASTPRAFGDPILFTDHETGRTFVSQLEGLTPLGSTTDFTDNDGDMFLPSQGSGIATGIDHQTIGGGPLAAPLTGNPANPLYKNGVWYCSQALADASCALSLDGGVTFGAQVPIYTGLPFGHVRDKLTLPVGGRCMLETRDGMARLTLSHYA